MADLTITAVRLTDDSAPRTVTAAETLAIGDVVYVDATDGADQGKVKLAAATTLELSIARGICITPAIANGPVQIIESGNIIFVGAGMSPQRSLVLSANAGKIALEADLVVGNFVTNIGRPVSAEEAWLSIRPLLVAVP